MTTKKKGCQEAVSCNIYQKLVEFSKAEALRHTCGIRASKVSSQSTLAQEYAYQLRHSKNIGNKKQIKRGSH